MSTSALTRRDLLAVVGAPLRQHAPHADGEQRRLPPLGELVNVLEFDGAAKIKLDPAVYAAIGGSHRDAFDRITLWPRVFIDSAPLNLATELFGEKMFAPILVGPVGQQRQFHPDGEHATVQGASAAKATVVISSRSSYPIEEIKAKAPAGTSLWYQAFLERDSKSVRSQIERAINAGCRAVCLTLGGPWSERSSPVATGARPDWRAIEQLRQGISVPVLLKGVTTASDAQGAVDRGIQGIVVSNRDLTRGPATIEVLASVVDAVGARVPVLVDGSFRRGTDVIKALAFGARAVLLGRPPMWGLAAYGADGVQAVLQLLQAELARTMINVGKPTLDTLDRSLLKIHRRGSS
jgi:4-hydroxymandelate oxidase